MSNSGDEQTNCGNSSRTSGANTTYFSVGREFYDDCYSDSEESVEDRLDFSSLKVRGREQENQTLHDVYNRVQRIGVDTEQSGIVTEESSVVMIKGLSGTGKSTLVNQFFEDLTKKSQVVGGPTKPFFLSGKYDELSGADPFSAIVEAFSGFASSLLEGDQEELEHIREAIKEALGAEANVLSTVVPDLRAVLGDESPATGSKENEWNRLKYIFQKFSNAISSKKRPVVMFLDDLQWCDMASLDLLQALLADKDLRYFMFIGSYRADEVEQGHPLIGRMDDIETSQTIEKIDLVNLSVQELNEFVADALKLETEETLPLTEVVHRKTKGNIFFAIQMLEELQRKGILSFSRMTFQWDWLLDDVDIDDLLSDDVVQAVTAKITSTPQKLQKALAIAAYTRSTVGIETLRKLMKLDGCSVEQDDLVKLLDKGVVQGLLSNTMGSKSYSFAHDRIQQAAYSLVPAGRQRDAFRKSIGKWLYDMASSDSGEDWMLFAAADHLNASASSSRTSDPMYLTRLNLEVGKRAASVAAYEVALKYLGLALQFLLDLQQPWENQYDITLQVYQSIAEVELCQGHFEVGKEIGQQVLSHAKRLEDKLATQLALSKALGREKKHSESLQMSVTALRLLGEYPKGFIGLHVGLVKNFLAVKRYLKKKSNEDILSLRLMNDPVKESAMAFLATAAYQSHFCQDDIGFLAATLRMLRITFKYGLCGQSGVAFTAYCLVCNKLNDMRGAVRYATVASRILILTKAKELECLQLFVVAHWISAWKEEHSKVLGIYARGHKSGMETGDFDNGLLISTASYHHEFVAGYHLGPIEIKFGNLMEKLRLYKVESIQVMTREQWLVIQHLRGTATSKLDFAELDKFGPETHQSDETYRLLYGYLGRLQLGVYFGDYKFAERMFLKVAPMSEFDKSHSTNSLRLFFGSLTYSTLAKETGKKSYHSKARKIWKQLKALCKSKGKNSAHRCLIMEAHLRSFGGNIGSNVQNCYDEAITEAIKSGHKHDAALASQLAADFFLSMDTNILPSKVLLRARDKLVGRYLTQARDYYKQWGATALVRSLEKKYGSYLDPLSKEQRSTAVVSCEFGSVCSTDLEFGLGSLPPILNMAAEQYDPSRDDMSVLTD